MRVRALVPVWPDQQFEAMPCSHDGVTACNATAVGSLLRRAINKQMLLRKSTQVVISSQIALYIAWLAPYPVFICSASTPQSGHLQISRAEGLLCFYHCTSAWLVPRDQYNGRASRNIL